MAHMDSLLSYSCEGDLSKVVELKEVIVFEKLCSKYVSGKFVVCS